MHRDGWHRYQEMQAGTGTGRCLLRDGLQWLVRPVPGGVNLVALVPVPGGAGIEQEPSGTDHA